MGRKSKIGKQRKDKFYHLAKETGYRSRAAFKLIQLNRRFEFLQKAKVLVDLCAAPGGWLQVAVNSMPVSSVVLGIDLVPIKPIHNALTFQCDITTPQCKTLLKRELKTWKADVFLNDGAPNLGKSWTHDAFSQVRLTLSALKLATEFLIRGGWFITKVFRCKDYNALVWLLGKLFKKVHATKPQASRHESAEIFIVCEKYLAPDTIDPKFFNPSYLFDDISPADTERKRKADLLKPVSKQKKIKAEGYSDNISSLYKGVKASDFIKNDKHIELLSEAYEILIDTDEISNHPLTTEGIKEYCKDIKVLSRKELLELIHWRKKLRDQLFKLDHKESKTPNEIDIEPEDEIDEEAQALRKKKKQILKQRKKLNERMNLKMILKDDTIIEEDMELFTLKDLKRKGETQRFEEIGLSEFKSQIQEKENDVEEEIRIFKPKYELYKKDSKEIYDDFETDEEKEEEELLDEGLQENINIKDIEMNDEEENELLIDFDERTKKEKNRLFFDRNIFKEKDFQHDDDIDLTDKPKKKIESAEKKKKIVTFEENEEIKPKSIFKHPKACMDVKLDPEELALGTAMIHSKKAKNDILDDAWNRYTHADDEFLPSWFKKDEEHFNRKPLPVSGSIVKEYKENLRAVGDRPIKKAAEAKARKRKRALRRLEKARKKVEALTDAPDMSEKEKAATIRSIYKKALKKEDRKITYVVSKKGVPRRRPPGVKGRYRMVDRRMKKDKLAKGKNENVKKTNRKTKEKFRRSGFSKSKKKAKRNYKDKKSFRNSLT